jgi:hypothetical protein
MVRQFWDTIYIDKDPADPRKGWSWIQVLVEERQRLDIPRDYPKTYTERLSSPGSYLDMPNSGNLPSRGKSGTKKFLLNLNGELIQLRAHKSLTIAAVCAWVSTWASSEAHLITPGGRTHALSGEKSGHQAHFVYFIFNEESNAIKIGHAKDISKRLKALQTSSPAPLKLLKSIHLEGVKTAKEREKALHQQFSELHLSGEWFRAEPALMDYISQL